MSTVDHVLERLDRVKKAEGGYSALCPAHNDKNPSLSIRAGDDGRVLIHCHAGCTTDAVLHAAGLTTNDLFDRQTRNGVVRREVARHPYHDEAGNHLFDIVRFNTGPKCMPYLPGAARPGIGTTERPLYRLPHVLGSAKAGHTIYVCEGERDADALHDAGVIATTNPFGAGPEKWLPEHTEALAGAHVVIVQDRDDVGRKRGQHLLRILEPVAASIRLLEPVVGKDVHDHIAAGCTVDELAAVEANVQVVEQTAGAINLPAAKITWERLSQIEMRSIVFLDWPLLQASAFHLVVGRKGQGKGTVLSNVAARVTRGELGDKRNVVWIGSEDSASIDIKPRIVAAAGDPERILIVKAGWIQLPSDLDEIQRAMTAMGDVGMVVIDPVGNHISGKNSDKDTDIRDAIAPLNQLADDFGCMVMGVRHLSEKECKGGVLAAILGSSAWVQVPRAVLAVARDDENPEISHIQCVAGNRLPAGTPGRKFQIEGVIIPGLDEEITCAVWTGDSDKDVESMLSKSSSSAGTSKTSKARSLILDLLEDEGYEESDALDARIATETGLAARSVRNIRKALSNEGLIRSVPDKDEHGEVQRWRVCRTKAPR